MGLLVVVSGAIFGLAKLVPFEPSADPAAAPGGDATRGAALFATNCAGCHGSGGAGGGIGPTLAGVPRDATDVASVIATGRGAMPSGLVTGTDAADVVAYVTSIGGGAAPTATAPTTPEGTQKGTVTFVGDRLQGLTIQLNEPAPEGWAVWVDGPVGVRRVASITANERTVEVQDAGLGSLAAGSDAVLVGASAETPALRADITGLGELLVTSPIAAGEVSLIDGLDQQVGVLRKHIVFLRKALDEGNLANIRFHGEHMVNISRGDPARDVDGNGDPSNPGDGVGLVGQGNRDGYLTRIVALAGPDLAPGTHLDEEITAIARAGEQCAKAASLAAGRPCVEVIAARDREVARFTTAVGNELRAKATIPLLTVP